MKPVPQSGSVGHLARGWMMSKLSDRIEAGEYSLGETSDLLGTNELILVMRTLKGDLTSAEALHNAVLPGWGYEIGFYINEYQVDVWKQARQRQLITGLTNVSAAVAWLAAIVRVFEEKGGG